MVQRRNKLFGGIESRQRIIEELIFKDEKEFTSKMRKEETTHLLRQRDETELILRATSYFT